MTVIAKTRIEAIDWIQEQLDNVPRPLAEQTFYALLESGVLLEGPSDIALAKSLSNDELRQTGIKAATDRDNEKRGMRLQKRRSVSTNKQQHKMHMKQLNAIDCVNDEGSVAR